jgi:hypothetical protein
MAGSIAVPLAVLTIEKGSKQRIAEPFSHFPYLHFGKNRENHKLDETRALDDINAVI